MTSSIMAAPILLAVPNFSEGRDEATIARIGTALAPQLPSGGPAGEVRLLDVHSDADHHRSVFTIAGRAPAIGQALLRGASAAVEQIDVVARARGDAAQAGAHPHVGAIDVVPLVYLDASARGSACAEALALGDRIASELDVPVFIYGELAGGRPGATRAELRRGGLAGLARRMSGADGQTPLRPDFGPPAPHASAGATLLSAREPLVAFNLQLAPPAEIGEARRIAALVREGGDRGLPGVRAIGVALSGGIAQVSMNIERPLELSLAEVVSAVSALAPIESAELVGLAPRAALERFPAELPIAGFDEQRHVIETALSANGLATKLDGGRASLAAENH